MTHSGQGAWLKSVDHAVCKIAKWLLGVIDSMQSTPDTGPLGSTTYERSRTHSYGNGDAVTATQQVQPDQGAIEAATMQMVGYLTGAALTAGVILGNQLAFYRHLADSGSLTAQALAERAGTNERITREWLDSQAAGKILSYNATDDTYALDDASAMVFANEDSPVFLADGIGPIRAVFMDVEHIEHATRGDGAFAWSDHHECLFAGIGRFFRPGYLNHLTSEWIPSIDGLADMLTAGAHVLDVGCGVGYSSVLIAEAFPTTTVTGVDYHAGSIELASENARNSTAADRMSFDIADAASYHGTFDLICFFDCLHDLGDPVGAAQHARHHLADDGIVMLVELWALDGRAANIDAPFAPLFYSASTFLCTTNSLSQKTGRALGAQSGEAQMRAVFQEAGFTTFHRTTETPFNNVYAARP
jgi:2-polyprenyl-3-methyl-5-hydroxy-6-metoxy-1,4-benzoquinol methylase